MDISIKNLGAISEANFTVGDLTVICGKNNTGKTYLTYAVYGFLDDWRNNNYTFLFDIDMSLLFLASGKEKISIDQCKEFIEQALLNANNSFAKKIKDIFSNQNNLQESSFNLKIDICQLIKNIKNKKKINIVIDIGKTEENFTLFFNADFISLETNSRIKKLYFTPFLNDLIKKGIISDFIPSSFVVSAERTGAALFQREVDFTRSRLIDLMKETSINPQQLLGRFTAEYPLPVKHNIDFIRDLPNIVDKQSEFSVNHPEVIAAFNEIAGGDYTVNAVGGINYTPHNQPDIKLTLAESSSTVRSLVDISFYLKHLAKQGDLLMIDEPELNLHPENQRKIARLFAMLVNAGIRVFITTHSDYIIKEFNTLLLLNKQDQRIKELAEREGYQTSELLKPEQLNIYMTTPDTNIKDRKAYSLIAANISAENGIELTSFDEVIEDMNRIQDEIVWG
ncbi:MAG: AAA family ATPase [Candidatus Thiocaldithrix dubininis]|uniref:AAA family ATPase n=1 Tax=Candidatus Thiocaldithrix dubininis TaxID=3080823 RepID=A0AA95H631_9GAMM|nr:MAG: AAA family ATPase [Candidatus Thiocaldithrix dubininis]